jgi:hypothetical protein
MLITEKILGDIGGWQAMKAARLMVAADAVEQTERAGDSFRGLVREGKRKFAAALTVQGPTKADCRCSCADAQRGLVCAHAMAVALAALQPAARPGPGGGTASSGIAPAAAPGNSRATPPAKAPPRGTFDVFIPAQRMPAMAGGRGTLPVFLQFQAGGEETDPVARWLAEQDLSVQSGPLSLDAAMLGGFFNVLRGHARIWEGRPGVAAGQRRRMIVAADDNAAIALRAQLQAPHSVRFEIQAVPSPVISSSAPRSEPPLEILALPKRAWLWSAGDLVLSPLPESSADIGKLIFECLDKKSRGAVRDLRWLARNLAALEKVLPLATDETLAHLRLLPAEPRFVLELDGSPRQATVRAEALIGTVRHPVLSGQADLSEDIYPIAADDGSLTFFQRNTSRERRLGSELEAAGFSAASDSGWVLRGEREVAAFFAAGLPGLQRRHEIVFTERWKAAFRGWQRVAPQVRRVGGEPHDSVPGSRGWLDMEFAYEASDGFRVPRSELLRLLRGGRSTVRGPQGQTYVLDSESCDDFESLLSESGARLGEEGRVALSGDNGHVLNDFLASGQPISKLVLPEVQEVKRRLGDLAGRLRDYQLEGVRWLIASAEAGRGALLADDMGLGKTLQVIALLRWLATCEQPADCEQLPRNRALVVCPTSLIHNWSLEIQKFASDLPVSILHGSDRVIDKVVNNCFRVSITSYALLSRDLSQHELTYYQAVILDEASYIRNPETLVAKAAFSLQAPVRVALTGTPVENSVQDLWSLMRFVQPGFLGGQKDFAERYAKPLASAATDPETAARTARRLRTRLGPFVLRRTKKEVVRELPDKIENIILCDLSSQQKEVYKRLLEEGLTEIRDARRRGAGAGRMTMFTVLLRLRQACNDLRLLGLNSEENRGPSLVDSIGEDDTPVSGADWSASGGKWEALADIVDDALGGSHKVLIFSQFTGMLRLLREWLDARSVGFSYLDGSTRDRGAQVTAFQEDPAKRVFLISLKAGGFGLNLTAADHVILVEPWWNPAVEAQAIDRAHRIGQASVVTASRLIARGTVEERIMKLQATKREQMASAVEDDPLSLPGLTDGDLEELLG